MNHFLLLSYFYYRHLFSFIDMRIAYYFWSPNTCWGIYMKEISFKFRFSNLADYYFSETFVNQKLDAVKKS